MPDGALLHEGRSTTTQAMRLRFWGVRGGIATPGSDTIRYGGNTSCVELRCGAHLLILDAGTGLCGLGRKLAGAPGAVDLDLLLSHTHFDHISGLPFFRPHFDSATQLRIWGGHLPEPNGLENALRTSWSPPLMPDFTGSFRAAVSYNSFTAGDGFTLHPGLTVRTAKLCHPGGCTGYRIEWAGRSVAYVTDTEHPAEGLDPAVAALIDGADLLLYDASYTDEEYPTRVGWGHSTWQHAIKLADAASVGKLVLFHHDASHCDAFLDAIAALANQLRPGTELAKEQAEFVLEADAGMNRPMEPLPPPIAAP